MIAIGYLFLICGFLGGALTAVWETENVNWLYFALAAALSALGVICLRVSQHGNHHRHSALEDNMQALSQALIRITDNIKILDQEVKTISPYEVHRRIDELFPDDIDTFVDTRKTIAHKFSLQRYSEVMNHFSAAERYLNRVWSASVDGYIDEVQTYTAKARHQFETTRQLIATLN